MKITNYDHPRFGQLILALLFTMAAALYCCGCASAHKKSDSTHELWEYNVVTNGGKAQSLLSRHEVWRDYHKGGGTAVFADPKASAISSSFTNQSALGGASTFNVGELNSVVSDKGIDAAGGAAGKVIGEAVKAIAK